MISGFCSCRIVMGSIARRSALFQHGLLTIEAAVVLDAVATM